MENVRPLPAQGSGLFHGDAMNDLGPLAGFVEAEDPERFAAALLAKPDKRPGLMALLALNAEIARVGRQVHEPMIAEIRLAWWREALAGLSQGGTRGHPVLQALLPLVEHRRITVADLVALADARAFDLSDQPMADEDAFAAYADGIAGRLMRLCLQHLGATGESGLVAASARVHLRVNHLRGLWGNLARGKIFLGLGPILSVESGGELLAARPAGKDALAWFDSQMVRAAEELAQIKAAWRRDLRSTLPVFAHLRLTRAMLKRVRRAPFALHRPPTPGERSRAILMAAITGRPL